MRTPYTSSQTRERTDARTDHAALAHLAPGHGQLSPWPGSPDALVAGPATRLDLGPARRRYRRSRSSASARRSRCPRVGRTCAGPLAMAAGSGVGLAAVSSRLGLAPLATGILVTGALIGVAQATRRLRRPPTSRLGRSLAWPLVVAVAWALGWTVTTAIGVDPTAGLGGLRSVGCADVAGRDAGRRVRARRSLGPGGGMTATVVMGVLLILVPILFNVVFADLARTFEYPDILRKEPGEILTRFRAGGSGPRPALVGVRARRPRLHPVRRGRPGDPGARHAPSRRSRSPSGIAAGLVQAIGLVRWPFLVPELARRYTDPAATQAQRDMVELVFSSDPSPARRRDRRALRLPADRPVVRRRSRPRSARPPPTIVPAWLAIPGFIVGLALMIGSLEFVGPNEPTGWSVADKLVPIAYIGWSAWLVVLGIFTILSRTAGGFRPVSRPSSAGPARSRRWSCRSTVTAVQFAVTQSVTSLLPPPGPARHRSRCRRR